jgi:diadenylate cyclase
MLEGFLHLFARRPVGNVLTDIADILLVTYVLYRALLVLRGTRAMQMGMGLGVIFLVYVVSKWADFTTLLYLLNALPIILIVVVVFQNDIRRGLMRVGARAFLAGLSRQQESKVIDEVVSAATDLARHRIGALIAFEQDANLDEFVVGQGTPIDATVQRELLVSLFLPESLNKLHDGAVVIRNLRIAKAGVFFPMPDTKILDKSLGSRHRAALGITEETDAVVVVVSEERGTISFCFNGNVVTNLDGASLRQALLGLFGQSGARKRGKTGPKRAAGTVTQTGTGTFRITVPPPSGGEPRSSRPVEPPPAPLGPSEATGSAILAPPVPRGEASPKTEKEAAKTAPKPNARPMAPAKPIETPKPVSTIVTPIATPIATPAVTPAVTPNRPTED